MAALGTLLLCATLVYEIDSAKRAPRVAVCRSNLKQLGLALALYGQDYDERFPPAAYVEGTHAVTLPALLHPYLGSGQVWECPTAAKAGTKNEDYDGTPDDTTTGYGYNGHTLAPGRIGITRAQVRDEANTAAFVDADTYLAVPPPLAPALGGTAPVYRHSGEKKSPAINVGWLDGHAKLEVPGRLEEVATREEGRTLRGGIESFRYWNRW